MNSYGITDPGTFVLGTIFIVLLPGPNSLYVMSLAASRGVTSGWRAAAGVFAGDSVLMLLSALGAASLLGASPLLFAALKATGAVYLAWIGVALLRSAFARRREGEPVPGQRPSQRAERPFRTALLISLLNPKAILFFVSFFVQFVEPGYPHPALSFLLLGAIVQACSAAYLSALILGGSTLARRLGSRPRLAALLAGLTGALFVAFGLRLAGASLA